MEWAMKWILWDHNNKRMQAAVILWNIHHFVLAHTNLRLCSFLALATTILNAHKVLDNSLWSCNICNFVINCCVTKWTEGKRKRFAILWKLCGTQWSPKADVVSEGGNINTMTPPTPYGTQNWYGLGYGRLLLAFFNMLLIYSMLRWHIPDATNAINTKKC